MSGSSKRLIVHCSDLHYGRGFLPDRARRLIEHIERLSPDAVVVSGDLTMRARRRQFSAARDFLQRIPAPFVVIPGNHDVPLYNLIARALWPLGNYNRYVAGLGQNPIQLDGVAIYALDTVNPRRHQRGLVTSHQVDFVNRWAERLPADSWRIVVTHQHFMQIPGKYRPGAIPGAKEILGRFAQSGIHAILCGHMHFRHVCTTRDFFSDLPRPLAMIHAGTATSGRTRAILTRVNSFNAIEFQPERFIVTAMDWDDSKSDFVAGEQSLFDRAFFGEPAPRPT